MMEREHGVIVQHNGQEFTSQVQAFRNFVTPQGLVRNLSVFEDTGSGFVSPQHRLQVQVPQNSGQPLQVLGRYSGTGYLLRPLGSVREAIFVNENLIRYADVWPDVDMEIQLGPRGVKIDYVVTGPSAPEALEFSLTPLMGAVLEQNEAGEILVGSEEAGFLFPIPLAEDGREGAFTLQGNTLTLTLPDLSSVSYPYRVDPYAVEIGQGSEASAIYDGYTQRSSAGSTWASLRDGNGTTFNSANTTFYVGFSNYTTTDQYTNNWRGILNFPTTVGNHIPASAIIYGATVELTHNVATNGYTTSPDYNIIFTYGDEGNFTPAAASYQSVGGSGTVNGGGNFPKWSDTQSMDSMASNTAYTWTLNATALAALPNRSAGQTNWNFGIVVEEPECDGTTPPWESGVIYRSTFLSNDTATASQRPLLTINFTVQPVTAYQYF